MPFNLAGTQALSGLAEQGKKTIAWTHDLAAANPDYKIPPFRTFDLIRERQRGVKYVTISETRAAEFRKLMGADVDAVIPNGMDVAGTCTLTPEVADLVRKDLPGSTILFYPTRILARKNIAFALQIVGAIRDLGMKIRLLVSASSRSPQPLEFRTFCRPETTGCRPASGGVGNLGQRALLRRRTPVAQPLHGGRRDALPFQARRFWSAPARSCGPSASGVLLKHRTVEIDRTFRHTLI